MVPAKVVDALGNGNDNLGVHAASTRGARDGSWALLEACCEGHALWSTKGSSGGRCDQRVWEPLAGLGTVADEGLRWLAPGCRAQREELIRLLDGVSCENRVEAGAYPGGGDGQRRWRASHAREGGDRGRACRQRCSTRTAASSCRHPLRSRATRVQRRGAGAWARRPERWRGRGARRGRRSRREQAGEGGTR